MSSSSSASSFLPEGTPTPAPTLSAEIIAKWRNLTLAATSSQVSSSAAGPISSTQVPGSSTSAQAAPGSSFAQGVPGSSPSITGKSSLADKYNIPVDVLRSRPRVSVLKGFLKQINEKLPKGAKLVAGDLRKDELQNRLCEFLGLNDVGIAEKVQDPVTAHKDLEFARIDVGYAEAIRYANRTVSEKSFEDCDCDDCRNKVWRSLGNPLADTTESVEAAGPSTVSTSTSTQPTVPPTLTIIPRVNNIVDAVRQWEDGTIKRLTDPYRGTAHWHIFKNTVSKRKRLYQEYLDLGCDVDRFVAACSDVDATGQRTMWSVKKTIDNLEARNSNAKRARLNDD